MCSQKNLDEEEKMSLYRGFYICPKGQYILENGIDWNSYSATEIHFYIIGVLRRYKEMDISDIHSETITTYPLEVLKKLGKDLLEVADSLNEECKSELERKEVEKDIDDLNYYGNHFLKLYDEADKENDWLLYWEEAL